jgi:hypothetical protein
VGLVRPAMCPAVADRRVALAPERARIDAADNVGRGVAIAPPFPPPRWPGGTAYVQQSDANATAASSAVGALRWCRKVARFCPPQCLRRGRHGAALSVSPHFRPVASIFELRTAVCWNSPEVPCFTPPHGFWSRALLVRF